MAQVLVCVAEYGVEAVQAALEAALASGRPSGEHVLNVLARQRAEAAAPCEPVDTHLSLAEEPRADVQRNDQLWQEVNDVQ